MSPAEMFAGPSATPAPALPANAITAGQSPQALMSGAQAPGMDSMNSAALLGLQGQQPPLPPNYGIKTQPDGSLLLMEQHPDGTEVAVKIISPPKRFGQNKSTGQPPQ